MTTASGRTWHTTLNLVIAAAALLASLLCLWIASHAHQWWLIAAAALVFSFTNNTLFSLHHEAVHGLLHPNPVFNDWLGRFLAAGTAAAGFLGGLGAGWLWRRFRRAAV